ASFQTGRTARDETIYPIGTRNTIDEEGLCHGQRGPGLGGRATVRTEEGGGSRWSLPGIQRLHFRRHKGSTSCVYSPCQERRRRKRNLRHVSNHLTLTRD